MEFSVTDEIECLKSSYDAKEFSSFISNQSPILKFQLLKDYSVTFEIPESYPQKVPLISLSSSKLINAEKIAVEEKIRNYAVELIGSPMIMDLVIKLQEILEVYCKSKLSSTQRTPHNEDTYMAVILIDHIRQKNRYSKALCSWASDLSICGSLILYHRWIFLILQGTKLHVKEFIIRLKTVCIDVDASGKPCKEKMSKILIEGSSAKSFPSFEVKELEIIADLESYLRDKNVESIYKDLLKPLLKC